MFGSSGMGATRTVMPMTTGIPLSQRFQQTRQVVETVNSPFRVDFGINNKRPVIGGLEDDDGEDLVAPRITTGVLKRNPPRNRSFQKFGEALGFTNNDNLIAVKDAEIKRLRGQLKVARAHLIIAMSRSNGLSNVDRVLRTTAYKDSRAGFLTKRAGGGVRIGNRGRRIALINKKRAEFFTKSKPGISPLNRKAGAIGGTKTAGGSNNFFGEPRTREALDEELEAYMSKSKGKQKTDLDKELDEYMKVARQQSFAARLGISSTIPIPTTTASPVVVEDMDANMEEA